MTSSRSINHGLLMAIATSNLIALVFLLMTCGSAAMAQSSTQGSDALSTTGDASFSGLLFNNNRKFTGNSDNRGKYFKTAMGAAAAAARQPDFPGIANQPAGSDMMKNQTELPGHIVGGSMTPGTSLYSVSGNIPISFYNFNTFSKADENIVKNNWVKTSGRELTDSSMAIIENNIARVQNSLANDPQSQMHKAEAEGQAQATQAGNAAGDASRDQAAGAISFCANYLQNFTTQPQWNALRDQIFVPMAMLLLLPGALLAQVRAIVAAGSPVLGEVNPFEGILRSIVAIFLIPATALVVNYGIDLNNSIMYTISSQYQNIFGSNMYKDALCAEIRATPVRQTQSNRNAYDLPTYQGTPLMGGSTPFAQFEGKMMENSLQDPCSNINIAPQERADEAMSSGVAATRLMMNGSNATLCSAWNILCAFQMAYLYYLWCVGPIMAALWVYPLRTLRNALPSWVEGVVTLCFWSLFWNTVILLMACFKGVDETGTMLMTALNFLATASVKYAFDFAGLVKAAGQEAAGMAAGAAQQAAAAGGGVGHHGRGTGSHGSEGRRRGDTVGSGGSIRHTLAELTSSGKKIAEAEVGGIAPHHPVSDARLWAAADGASAIFAPRGLESLLCAASTPFWSFSSESGKKLSMGDVTDSPPLSEKGESRSAGLDKVDARIDVGLLGSHEEIAAIAHGMHMASDDPHHAFALLASSMTPYEVDVRDLPHGALERLDGHAHTEEHMTVGGEGRFGLEARGIDGCIIDGRGIESRGLDGLGIDGISTAERGSDGDDGNNISATIFGAIDLSAGNGLTDIDVLRTVEMGNALISPALLSSSGAPPTDSAFVAAQHPHEPGDKHPFALELANLCADPNQPPLTVPLPLNDADSNFRIAPNAIIVDPPPSEKSAANLVLDPNGQPAGVGNVADNGTCMRVDDSTVSSNLFARNVADDGTCMIVDDSTASSKLLERNIADDGTCMIVDDSTASSKLLERNVADDGICISGDDSKISSNFILFSLDTSAGTSVDAWIPYHPGSLSSTIDQSTIDQSTIAQWSPESSTESTLRVTDSWFNHSNDSSTDASNWTAAAPLDGYARHDVIGQSDLGLALPVVPRSSLASFEHATQHAPQAATQHAASQSYEPPRALAMNSSNDAGNRLSVVLGRALGKSHNSLPTSNNKFVGQQANASDQKDNRDNNYSNQAAAERNNNPANYARHAQQALKARLDQMTVATDESH